MDNKSRFAVTDGPDGIRWVKAPDDREVARTLKSRHGSQFWCAKRAGGCGGRISLHAGDIRVVHFAHHPGEGTHCPFRWDLETEERSYLHLALQLTLQTWLRRQGIECTLEMRLEHGGRADLHISAVDLTGAAQTLEVQLSPMRAEHWSARTALYLRSVQTVSWIFGSQVADPVLNEACREQGYALRVRLAESAAAEGRDIHSPESIEIGTQTSHGLVDWACLTQCSLIGSGLMTPFTQAAIDQHAALLRPLPVYEVRPASHPSAGGPGRARVRPPGRPTTEPLQQGQPVGRLRPIERPTTPLARPRGWGRGSLASYESFGVDPKAAASDWPTLPEDLRYAAAVMAHIVTSVDSGGPDWSLSFSDLDDRGLIQQALVGAGLIELYEGTRSVTRWQRRR